MLNTPILKLIPRFLLFLSVLLINAISFSQNHSVSGYVRDISQEPISFANVIILSAQDSSLVRGVSTNNRGYFELENLPPDTYVLKCTFLGYEDSHKTFSLDQSLELEAIILEESSQVLNEINIHYRRPTLKKEVDRLVFNVEHTALIEGSIFDVLKSTPGVLVMDNEMRVKNSKPIIYLNDRKVFLSSEELIQLLESSPANAIKLVEVITNPSAKYDGESGAVINIVMSKNLITGYRGSVFGNFTQGVFPRYDAGMSHFYKNDKMDVFANYSFSNDKINRDQEDVINYLDDGKNIDQIFKSNINRNTWKKTHNFNVNVDYSFDEKNILSLTSNMLLLPHFDYKIENKTQVFDANKNLDYYFDADNFSKDDKYNLGFDLDYVHKFDEEDHQLSVNAHFTTYNYSRNQNVESHYFEPDATFLKATAFRTDNHQDTKIYTAKVDYVTTLGTSSIFEIGAKASNIKNDSGITQYEFANGLEIRDPNNSNAYDYDETIFAGYANISKEWEKFSLVAGLRAEQTEVEGVSIYDNVTNKQKYLEWFPSASLSYAVSENFSVFTNYKRSIQRPSYQDLNPFQFYLNDVTIVTGNPNLQPIKIDYAVLGTTFGQGGYTIEAYYKSSADNIFELPLQDNENHIITNTPVNLRKTTEYGLDFLSNFNILDGWTAYVLTSFFNAQDQGTIAGAELKKDRWANYTTLSNNLTFLKDRSLNANFSLVYISKNVNGFREIDNLLFSNLSVSKTIFNKKATVSLLISDLFNTQKFRMRSRYLNQDNLSIMNEDTRTVKLGFRYNFGNSNLKTNQRMQSEQEIERLEKQNGN